MLNARYVMVLMLVLAMILAACNGDDEEEDDNTDNNTATTAPAGDATEAPAAGDATTEAPAGDATTEAPAADATGEAGGATGALTTDAEAAIVAYLSGDFAEAQTYFCADVASQIEAAGSAAGASGVTLPEGAEVAADCTESGNTVTCEVTTTVSGVATPAVSYSMTATDGQLCGLPTPVQ